MSFPKTPAGVNRWSARLGQRRVGCVRRSICARAGAPQSVQADEGQLQAESWRGWMRSTVGCHTRCLSGRRATAGWHRHAQPRPSSLRAGAVRRCTALPGGRRATILQHQHTQPRPSSHPRWRRAALLQHKLLERAAGRGSTIPTHSTTRILPPHWRRAAPGQRSGFAGPLEWAAGWWPPAATAAQRRLQPVVLNSVPPGRTRDQLATPILPPRWRRAVLWTPLLRHSHPGEPS